MAEENLELCSVNVDGISFQAIPKKLAETLERNALGQTPNYEVLVQMRKLVRHADDYPEILLGLSWLMAKVVDKGVYIDDLQDDLDLAKGFFEQYAAHQEENRVDIASIIASKIDQLETRIMRFQAPSIGIKGEIKSVMQNLDKGLKHWHSNVSQEHFKRDFGNGTYAIVALHSEYTDHVWMAPSLRISNREFDETYKRLTGRAKGFHIQVIFLRDTLTGFSTLPSKTYKFAVAENPETRRKGWLPCSKMPKIMNGLMKNADTNLKKFNHTSGLSLLRSIKHPLQRTPPPKYRSMRTYQTHHFLQAMLGRFDRSKYTEDRETFDESDKTAYIDLRTLDIPVFSFLK